LGNGSIQLPGIPLNKLSYWHRESAEFITLSLCLSRLQDKFTSLELEQFIATQG